MQTGRTDTERGLLCLTYVSLSLCKDGMLPVVSPERFPWIAEPKTFLQKRWSLLLAYLVIQSVVFVGSPAIVTPLLSISFLFFASYVEARA